MELSGKREKLSNWGAVLWILSTWAVSGSYTYRGGFVHTHTLHCTITCKVLIVYSGCWGLKAEPRRSTVRMALPSAWEAILSKLNARCKTGFLLHAPLLWINRDSCASARQSSRNPSGGLILHMCGREQIPMPMGFVPRRRPCSRIWPQHLPAFLAASAWPLTFASGRRPHSLVCGCLGVLRSLAYVHVSYFTFFPSKAETECTFIKEMLLVQWGGFLVSSCSPVEGLFQDPEGT